MDPTLDSSGAPIAQSGPDLGAWVMARAGYAIDAAVDRNVNGNQVINDSGATFGMGADGKLYRIGQPSGQVVASVNGAGTTGGIPPVLILALIGLLLIHHA